MKKLISTALFLLLLIAMSVACFAKENGDLLPSVPKSNIYLQDYAKVINEEINKTIMNSSFGLKKQTTAQVVVVTIKSLNEMPIKEYTLGVFRKWGIGNKDKNNGILILVVTSTKQVRIEVGYGLEGRLPDAKCGEIIRNQMLPSIGIGDFNTGIINGYNAVIQEVAREYDIDPAGLNVNITNAKPQENGIDSLSLFDQVAVVLLVISLLYGTYRLVKSGGIYNRVDSRFSNSSTDFNGGGSANGGSVSGDSFGGGDAGGGGADS